MKAQRQSDAQTEHWQGSHLQHPAHLGVPDRHLIIGSNALVSCRLGNRDQEGGSFLILPISKLAKQNLNTDPCPGSLGSYF